MKKPLIIFGTGQIAEIAHFYFMHDSQYKVAGFTVDRQYIKEDTFCGLPIVPFDVIEQHFPPQAYNMFVALSYANLNAVREEKYLAAKTKNYQLASYVSSKATIWPNFQAGDNCFILEDNTIQPFTVIGNNVVMWSGNHLGHHSIVHDHCFISSHVVISGGVTIGRNCFIGVNASIRDHIILGKMTIVGMGAVITKNTIDYSVYKGNASRPFELTSEQISL